MRWAVFALVLATFVGVLAAAARSRTLFVLRARAGRVVGLRGRAPGELVRDLEDVVASRRADGEIAVRIEGGAARVIVSGGIDEPTAQRARNVVGRFPLARLKAAPRLGAPRG